MASGTRNRRGDEGGNDAAMTAYGQILERAPAAFAVTQGSAHVLVSANEKFRALAASRDDVLHRPVAEVLAIPGLIPLLDRALAEGLAYRDQSVGVADRPLKTWSCSVWPQLADGDGDDGLVIELNPASGAEPALAIQRELSERMLLGALREKDTADAAEAAEHRASFLSDAGRVLAASIDEEATRHAVRAMHLPGASWCIVDVIEADGATQRLGLVHPDPAKEAAVTALEDWAPDPADAFGGAAMLRRAEPLAFSENVDEVLARTSSDERHRAALRELGAGSLLTVPMVIHGRLTGAITFVSSEHHRPFTKDAIRMGQELALLSAMALNTARLYREALELRATAELANRAKSEFLAHMSHELRTPLNAIAGYVDLIDLGIRGPVTETQRADLARIRASQKHLLVMINEILRFVHVESGKLTYDIGDLAVRDLVLSSVELIEPLMTRKQLVHRALHCDAELRVLADADRTQQILVNLLTNAVKFTPSGGEITVACESAGDWVFVTVEDTGEGIEADQLDAVFEPFVQVRSGLTNRQGGVGLGLAISRDLARAMRGDLTVQSTPGSGSRFTLSLPRAGPPSPSMIDREH